jgi:hypothetical protein
MSRWSIYSTQKLLWEGNEIGFDYNTTSIKNVGSSAAQYSTKLDNDGNLYPRAQLFGALSADQVWSGEVEDSFEVDGVLDYTDLLVPLGQRL